MLCVLSNTPSWISYALYRGTPGLSARVMYAELQAFTFVNKVLVEIDVFHRAW